MNYIVKEVKVLSLYLKYSKETLISDKWVTWSKREENKDILSYQQPDIVAPLWTQRFRHD